MQNELLDRTSRSPLLPARNNQGDLFVCDIFDAVPSKADTASMEHPLFTLSTKPDRTVKEHQNGDLWLKLTPSQLGLATVHDRDILIYCISHLMMALNNDLPISKTLRFNAHDLLKTTNRPTNKKGYELFKNALKRLQGTQIETNITTGGKEQWEVFSFIESAKTVRETRGGRMQAIEITLSDWVFNAITEKGKDILTISSNYFRLRKPLERRLYEIARKKCGHNNYWHLKLDTLRKMTGSGSSAAEFKRMVKTIVADNIVHEHIPDYTFELDDNLLKIRRRQSFKEIYDKSPGGQTAANLTLKDSTYNVARKQAEGWDVYQIESAWRSMLADKKSLPDNPDGSFVGYVKWFVSENGKAR